MRITNIRHPKYIESSDRYNLWRKTYIGGRIFRDTYLKEFSKRENADDYKARRDISYVPAYAKAGINKIKNTFCSRMREIVRLAGPDSYRQAILGQNGGVDRHGSSMDVFLSESVVGQLLAMRRVGIFVDRDSYYDPLLVNNRGNKPYLYAYDTEDILSWRFGLNTAGEYVFYNVMLRDCNYVYDQATGLTSGTTDNYRHLWIGEDGYVHVQFYEKQNDPDLKKYPNDIKIGDEVILKLKRIPLVVPELTNSLLEDVSDYQIALMNVASSDINYVFKANFPFYTEQEDSAAVSAFTRRRPLPTPNQTTGVDANEGEASRAQLSGTADELAIGAMRGRKYGKGMDRPQFIAPPTEPLIASMKKQEQMKQEIAELLDIALANTKSVNASSESTQEGIETGLVSIGLELQWAESQIAEIWAMYENDTPAVVKYPSKYTLKSDSQRLEEAKALNEVKASAPSKTFGKEVAKQVSHVMLSEKVSNETLTKIDAEIDKAEYITSDPATIKIASDLGMVDAITGSNALGFNGEKVVPLAKEEHTTRLAEIAKAQSVPNPAARGIPDQTGGQNTDQQAKNDKLNPLDQKTSANGRGPVA